MSEKHPSEPEKFLEEGSISLDYASTFGSLNPHFAYARSAATSIGKDRQHQVFLISERHCVKYNFRNHIPESTRYLKGMITVKLTAQRKNIGKWNMGHNSSSPSNIISLSLQGCRPPTVLVSQILPMRKTHAIALNGPSGKSV